MQKITSRKSSRRSEKIANYSCKYGERVVTLKR